MADIETPEAGQPDPGVNELVDYTGAPEAEPTVATEPTPEETTGAEAAEAAPTAEPTEASYTIRGKAYKASELLARPDLLKAIVTTAEQFPHLQQKYQKFLEAQAERQAQPPAQQPQARPQAPGLSPVQVRAAYEPIMNQLVQAGAIEQDLAEAYPGFVAQALHISHTTTQRLAQAEQLLEVMADRLVSGDQQSEKSQVVGTMDRFSANLAAKEGEAYKALADPQERDSFYQFLAEQVNPPVSALNEDFMARMYVAYKRDEWATAIKAAQAQNAKKQAVTLRNAAGEGTGTRGSAPGISPAAAEIAEMIADF